MTDEYKQILNKLVSIDDSIKKIDITLAKQEVQIAYHIKRTNILEEELNEVRVDFSEDIKPIKTHVNMVQGVGAFLGILALIATIVAALR